MSDLKPTDKICHSQIVVKYDGKTFGPYPNPQGALTIEIVQRELAKQFPEAAKCEVTQKELENGLELTFIKKAGTKGMKFILSGRAVMLTAEVVERLDGDELSTNDWIEHKVIVDAPSKLAALDRYYHQWGDGYWQEDGTYLYWMSEPEVGPAPMDQQLVLLPPEIAPRLPGFVL